MKKDRRELQVSGRRCFGEQRNCLGGKNSANVQPSRKRSNLVRPLVLPGADGHPTHCAPH